MTTKTLLSAWLLAAATSLAACGDDPGRTCAPRADERASAACGDGYACVADGQGRPVCASLTVTCAGLSGLACPAGYVACVDDPFDGCEGERAADCAGLCVPAATPLASSPGVTLGTPYVLLMRVEGLGGLNGNPAQEKAMLPSAVVATLLVWAALVERIIRDPGNHVGPEPLLAIIPFVFVLFVTWLPRYRRWHATRSLVTGYVLLSIAALVAMDRANVLVEYERWVRRGMPDRPCGEVVRHIWACDHRGGP